MVLKVFSDLTILWACSICDGWNTTIENANQKKRVKNFSKNQAVFCQFSDLKLSIPCSGGLLLTPWSHWSFTGMKHEVKNSCRDVQTPLSCHPEPSAPIQHMRQPWNTKNGGFCQNEVQDGLLPVTPITNSSMMKPRMLFSIHSAPQTAAFGATESSACCNGWRESRVRLCSWFVFPAHPAVPPDGSSCGGGPAALSLPRDRDRDRPVAPVGHWRRQRGRKRAKPWLPEEHCTGH